MIDTIANQLYKIPDGARWSILRCSENISQISNNAYYYEERMQVLRNQCGNTSDPQPHVVSNLVRRSNMLDHLGFVLRSQSLFYCSVPKVATRTLLSYITYLHIHNELIHSLKNKSASYFNGSSGLFNGSSGLFNADYLNKMLSSSKQVNIKEFNFLFFFYIRRSCLHIEPVSVASLPYLFLCLYDAYLFKTSLGVNRNSLRKFHENWLHKTTENQPITAINRHKSKHCKNIFLDFVIECLMLINRFWFPYFNNLSHRVNVFLITKWIE
jgi:hypothetical protein